MGMGIAEATLKTIELEAHGDTANEIGAYTLRAGDGGVLDQGKYVVIWKREGGQWKLHRDIWNSSLPAPGS
jgi:ketosteroid isomerase-like protein